MQFKRIVRVLALAGMSLAALMGMGAVEGRLGNCKGVTKVGPGDIGKGIVRSQVSFLPRNVGTLRVNYGEVSAKSYVQDGLIAMWDFVENAGFGEHDATATTCVDLSGNGNTLTINPNGTYSWSWAEDGINLPSAAYGADFARCTSISADSALTVETVISMDGRSRYIPYVWGFGDKALWLYRDKRPHIQIGYRNASSTCWQFTKMPFLYQDAQDSSGIKLVASISQSWGSSASSSLSALSCNGSVGIVGNYNDSWSAYGDNGFHIGYKGNSNWPLYGKLHNIRIYNRKLTDNEKAVNLAVDNARFPLTNFSDAVPVEYLETYGYSAFGTLVSLVGTGMSAECDVSFTGTETGERCILCAGGQFEMYRNGSIVGCYCRTGDAQLTKATTTGTIYHITGVRGNNAISIDVDGSNASVYASNDSIAEEVVLMGYNINRSSIPPTISYRFIGRLHHAKVYHNGVLTMDITPVRVGSRGLLRDSVRDAFYADEFMQTVGIGPDK